MTNPPDDPTPLAHEAVEALAAANIKSNETLMNLVEKVREDAYMREKKVDLLDAGLKQTHRAVLMIGCVFALLLVIAIVNATNIAAARRQAAVTAETAKDARGTYQLLYGCFDPNSPCSKQNTATQKRLLDEIKQYELTALYCQRTTPEDTDPKGTAFLACVNRLYPGGPQLRIPKE